MQGRAWRILHSYSRSPRIATRVTTQQSHHIDLTRFFTSELFMRNGFTAYFALSPGTGLVCPRHLADASAKLDASVGASGPHDFAVRKVRARQSRHSRPSHPDPTFVTIAKRPFVLGRDGRDINLIWVRWKVKFLIFRNYLSPPRAVRRNQRGQYEKVTET
jgi:hypothetical protein